MQISRETTPMRKLKIFSSKENASGVANLDQLI